MADARFRDMNWGREKPWYHGREGALFMERSQGERETVGERAALSVHARCHGVGYPGSYWERTFPFLEYIWKRVYCLSKDKRPTGHH